MLTPPSAPALQPYTKPALTFQDQLNQLMRRGMIVADPAQALITLQRISYYRLSAYWHPFKSQNDTFVQGTTFERAVQLYEFDRRLRLTVLDGIERVEVLIRTAVTYHLGHKYGAFAHAAPSNFGSAFDHTQWLGKLTDEITRANERFLEHFKSKYTGFPNVPIWMASELMSLGSLSRLFKGLLAADQDHLITSWGIHRTVATSWLHTLVYVRNVCAHHARLWNRELAIKPKLPNNLVEFTRFRPNKIYAVLCLLHHLLAGDPYRSAWSQEVVRLLREMHAEPAFRGAMGTPQAWASQSFWR